MAMTPDEMALVRAAAEAEVARTKRQRELVALVILITGIVATTIGVALFSGRAAVVVFGGLVVVVGFVTGMAD